jgi:hypothetical protein
MLMHDAQAFKSYSLYLTMNLYLISPDTTISKTHSQAITFDINPKNVIMSKPKSKLKLTTPLMTSS